MFTYNSKFSVNKPIDDVFNLIYQVSNNNSEILEKISSTEENINDNLYKIIEWDINNWCIIKGKRIKVENIYIYVNDLPEYLKDIVVEDDKFIRMRRKHVIINDGKKYKEVITKSKITNLKNAYMYILKVLNTLKLIKIKEKLKLTYLNDNETCVDIKVSVNILIPTNNEDLEKYLKVVFENLSNNIKTKILSK
jgi:hypothetical protein